jgi:hypothetical protein
MTMKRFLFAVALGTAAIVGPVQAQLKFNPNQVAILRWYQANQTADFPVGDVLGAAFDGVNLWVTSGTELVRKMRTSDGASTGQFEYCLTLGCADTLTGMAFDGANIWVADGETDAIFKLRASDGAVLGTFFVGTQPAGVAFDGANIWVTNTLSNNVTKLRASDGLVLGTFPVFSAPVAAAFDGANIWVANVGSDNVTKLRASDGTVLGTFVVGHEPVGVVFDGANIWVANKGSNNVTKLQASKGTKLGTFPLITPPSVSMAFDGANIWVGTVHEYVVGIGIVGGGVSKL